MNVNNMINLLGNIVISDNNQSRAANADMLCNDILNLKKQRDEFLSGLNVIWKTYITGDLVTPGTLAYIARDLIDKAEAK